MTDRIAGDTVARVQLLALPETTPGTFYALYELFRSVGVAWNEMTGRDADAPRIATEIVALSGEPFHSSLGTPIAPDASLAAAGPADVIVITDIAMTPSLDPRGMWGEEAAWLRRRFDDGAVLCSVCTGSVLLAEAGLLDGVEATTHWAATDIFERHYPGVRLHPERILCPAGPEHRIITGGGGGSGTDLALYLVARLCGTAEAVRIAKLFVLGDRSEGQLPFASMGRAEAHEDAVIARCQDWLADNYRMTNPVARMVALSGLPERSFKRRFRQATGYAPMDYVQALRIEEAKQMLETTGEPTDAVGHTVGYHDPAFFRRLFKRLTGVTPARYRQRYSAIGMARAGGARAEAHGRAGFNLS